MLNGLRNAIGYVPGAQRLGTFARQALGWLACSRGYLASLPEDSLLERAFTPRERRDFESAKRDVAESLRDLHARAAAEASRLGERYRMGLAAEVIAGRVRDDTSRMSTERVSELRRLSSLG